MLFPGDDRPAVLNVVAIPGFFNPFSPGDGEKKAKKHKGNLHFSPFRIML